VLVDWLKLEGSALQQLLAEKVGAIHIGFLPLGECMICTCFTSNLQFVCHDCMLGAVKCDVVGRHLVMGDN
jgi:hypothetical protein